MPSDEADAPQFPLPDASVGPQTIRYNILAGLYQMQQRVIALEAILSELWSDKDIAIALERTVSPNMMTSSYGNIFRVIGPLCGEFTGPGEFPTQRPVTRSFDVYFDLRLNKRLCKQSWGWWFETLLCPLWRHSNVKCVGNLIYTKLMLISKLTRVVKIGFWLAGGMAPSQSKAVRDRTMVSWHRNSFHIDCPSWRESTGVSGRCHQQGPVIWRSDIFSVVHLNKLSNKHLNFRYYVTPCRSCDITFMFILLM